MASGIRIHQGCYWSAKAAAYDVILSLTIEQMPERESSLKQVLTDARSQPVLDLTRLEPTDFQTLQRAITSALDVTLQIPAPYTAIYTGTPEEYHQFLIGFSLLKAMLKTDPRAYHTGEGSLTISSTRRWQADDTWYDMLLEHIAVSVDKPDLAKMLLEHRTHIRLVCDISALDRDDFYRLSSALYIYHQRYAQYVPGMSSAEVFVDLFPCLREFYDAVFFDARYFHPLVEALVKKPELETTLAIMTYLRDQALSAMERNTYGTLAVIHSACSYFIEYFAGISHTGANSIVGVGENLRTSLENFSKGLDWMETFPSEEDLLEAVERWTSARS